MKRLSLFLLLALVFAMPALAENNTLMKVHVEKAVAIPGHVLPAGDYNFQLTDISSGRSVVAITSADGDMNYGFVHVYTALRNSAVGSDIEVASSDGSGVDRIDSWFFPGETEGYRFIYSKGDLAKLNQVAEKLNAKGNGSGF